jgi:hypothetical protein
VLLSGCSRPSPAPAAVPAPVEEECTLQTPLKPGVPGSPGHFIPSDINANGASELATLMREMKADLEAARAAIEKGERVAPMHARHRKIRCAWPTGLEDRNPVFEASAISYLQQVRTLDSSPADVRAAYEGVVAGCLACHANSCPGPISAIEKLRLLPR